MSHCTFETCKGGNCSGCKDGKLWCEDPRCTPYCRECQNKEGHDEAGVFLFVTLILIFTFIVGGLLVVYGPRFVSYNDGDALESYNIIDNRLDQPTMGDL